MVRRSSAYVDTSAFISFVDRSDTHHALFAQLFSNPPSLVTTPLVISEGHAWFLRRYDRSRALKFLSMIEDMEPLEIADLVYADQIGATEMLRKFSDQDLTLADGLGLHIMHVRRIKRCWSTDFHLGLTGVNLVIHDH